MLQIYQRSQILNLSDLQGKQEETIIKSKKISSCCMIKRKAGLVQTSQLSLPKLQ